MHDEEVAGEVLRLDHPELLVDARGVVVGEVGILPRHRLPHQVTQPAHRRVTVGNLLARQRGPGPTQRKGQLVGERDRALDHPGIPREPLRHLGPRAHVRAVVRGQPPVDLVEPPMRPHRGDRGSQVRAVRHGVVHVVGGHHIQAALPGEGEEHIVVPRIERRAVIDQLDAHRIGAEPLDEPVELGRGAGGAGGGERAAHGALAASGHDHPVPDPRRVAGARSEVIEVVDWPALLAPGELGVGEGAGEPVIPLLAAGEHEQVGSDGVGFTVLRRGQLERQFRPEHRLQPEPFGGLGEADDAVEAVVVGDREGMQPLPLRLLGELLGRRGAVEEREG